MENTQLPVLRSLAIPRASCQDLLLLGMVVAKDGVDATHRLHGIGRLETGHGYCRVRSHGGLYFYDSRSRVFISALLLELGAYRKTSYGWLVN